MLKKQCFGPTEMVLLLDLMTHDIGPTLEAPSFLNLIIELLVKKELPRLVWEF